MTHPFFHRSPMVIAHRGDTRNFPENTLASFLSAAEKGAHCIESDLHLTSDNEVVMIHDETLERTTDGKSLVEKHTLGQIQSLDAGYWYTQDEGNTYPYRGKGITVPTLREVLEAMPDMQFTVDLKPKSPRLAEAFAETIIRTNALDRILCASAHDSNMRILREFVPDAATGCGTNEALGIVLLAGTGLLFTRNSIPGLALQIPPRMGIIRIIDPRLMQQYHQAGLYVHAWTVNSRDTMEYLLDAGIDGIVTDEIDLLIDLLDNREKFSK